MTTERIKEIQDKTAYPDSISVQQALMQVWNEVATEFRGWMEPDKPRMLSIKNIVLNPNNSIDIFFFDEDIMPINVTVNKILNGKA